MNAQKRISLCSRSLGLLAFLLAFLTQSGFLAFAQPQEEWIARFHDPMNLGDGETPQAVAVDNSGNVYVTGAAGIVIQPGSVTSTNRIVTIKYGPDGTPSSSWPDVGDGVGVRRFAAPPGYGERPVGMVLDAAGDVYIAGISIANANNPSDWDTVTIKYNGATGQEVWFRRYNYPQGGSLDRCAGIALDATGNIYVSGSNNYGRLFVLKYEPNGALSPTWLDEGDGTGVRVYWPSDSFGDLSVLGGGYLAVDPTGNVHVTGHLMQRSPWTGHESDCITLKFGPDGDLLWDRRYAGPGNLWDVPIAIALDSFGSVYVAGPSAGASSPVNVESLDYMILKYDPDGTPSSSWTDNGFGVGVRRYDSSFHLRDEPIAIALDADNDVVVAGVSDTGQSGLFYNPDYLTVKFDGQSGTLLWESRYNESGNNLDLPSGMALDSSGNVYVTGQSMSAYANTALDFATVKYNGATGQQEWKLRYNNPAQNSGDLAWDIAVDAYNNIYVTGSSWAGINKRDFLTIKYSENQPPVANNDTLTLNEDSSTLVDVLINDSDPNGDPLAITQVSAPSHGIAVLQGNVLSYTPTANYNGADTFTYTIQDTSGRTATATVHVTVNPVNDTPTATLSGPTSGLVLPITTPIALRGSYSDIDTNDTHTALWTLASGQNLLNLNGTVGTGTVSDDVIVPAAGVYNIRLAVTDSGSSTAIADTVAGLPAYVVVYDPFGGSVSGGGVIASPAGAYSPDPSLTGPASFGFTCRYHQGATVPDGQAQFRFNVAQMRFQSDTLEWLVVSGARAQFKGTGTINGGGDYEFMITVVDGDLSGGGGADRFRIRIWDRLLGGLVYDNQMGSGNNDPLNDGTILRGGNILIH